MITLDQTVEAVAGWVKNGKKNYMHVCTTQTVLECRDAPDLSARVNNSALNVPDGMPLVWLGKLHKHNVDRVYGPDLMLAICKYGLSRNYRHFLYGSTPEVLNKLVEQLRESFSGIVISGQFAPPFRKLSDEEKQDITQTINNSKSDIVWVCLGTPQQDYWVADFREHLDAPVLIPVGAAFNFHSGSVKQAPRWMMHCGLEWFFRLLMEPRRLWKRYLLGNPRFAFLALAQLIRGHTKNSS